jgi:hypothetical protein
VVLVNKLLRNFFTNTIDNPTKPRKKLEGWKVNMSENQDNDFEIPTSETPAGETAGNQTPGGEYQAPRGDAAQQDAGWQDVGRQFEALGQSLAQAVRTAWENESTQRQVQEMRTGLEAMVRDVEKAIKDSASSEQGQKIRSEAERAADSLKTATHQTVQEVRPRWWMPCSSSTTSCSA